VLAAAVAAAAAVGVSGAVTSSGYQLTAMFRNAGELLNGSVVRVDGVSAGSVTSLALHGGSARVTMQIDSEFLPIHRNATLTVRPVSLLGARYIDLVPGSASSPALPSGSVLPASQTSDAVNIQNIFNILNDPTSGALAALLASMGQGTAGQGTNIAATLRALAPVLGNVQPLLTLLDQQDQMLAALVAQVAPITQALATAHGQALASVVATAAQLLQVTAAKSQQLGSTVAQLPSTLSDAQQALAQVGSLAQQATPAISSLAPLTSQLTQVVDDLRNFSAAANPALPALDPVLSRADRLLVSLRPVVAQLQAAGPSLQHLSASSQPIVSDLTANLPNLFDFIENWALVTNGSDGVSHYFRAMVMANPNAATGNSPLTVPGIGPFGGGKPIALPAPKASLPANLLPNLNQLVDPFSKAVGGLLSGLLPGSSAASPAVPAAEAGAGRAAAGAGPSSPPGASTAPGSFPLSVSQVGSLLNEFVGGNG
jgi:phospholipid/cholesterol/gamma-HCH transport system substrate-binding protein